MGVFFPGGKPRTSAQQKARGPSRIRSAHHIFEKIELSSGRERL
jgi:hypothetical protein